MSQLVRRSYLTPRRPKFNNTVTTITVGGEQRTYHSRFESGYALMLHNLVLQGKLAKVEEQKRIRINVAGVFICTYIVDFYITLPNGQEKFLEAKGLKTDLYRIKKKLVEALFPEIPFLENPSEAETLQ